MRYIRRIALLLTALACAAVLAGCSRYKNLSDEELTEYLEKCYGVSFELISEPAGELYGNEEKDYYRLESGDGISVAVERERFQGMFGGHYSYSDDYIMGWLYARPELYSELTDSLLNWETIENGFTITPRGFDEVASAAEIACNISNRCVGVLPDPTYTEDNLEFHHASPCIYITGTDGSAGYGFYGGGVRCADESYDIAEAIFFLEQAYVDNVRSGEINEILPDEVLKRYPPKEIKLSSKLALNRLDEDDNVRLKFDRNETVYYCKDSCYAKELNVENPKDLPPRLENIAKWAKLGGYDTEKSELGYYSLSDGKNKVTFFFSAADECYVKKNGERVDIRGGVYCTGSEYAAILTSEDLEKLFDLEFEIDYLNGTAKVNKQEHK